jgi:TetR/AcrR family transcriptional regulator, multidrug resistance operon repressor
MRPKNLDKEQAIRTIALQIIAEEGLENLTMQKLAAAAGISPRTIYIKYKDKDDLLVKLYVEEVLGNYEAAILQGFDPEINFAEGVKKLWLNAFGYFKNNRHAFALMQYGKSSPLLNKAYQEMNIKEGDFFAPVLRFLELNVAKGVIKEFPHQVQRALVFAPALDLINEYFDYLDRPKQIITDEVFMASCEVVIRGMKSPS